MKKKVILVIRDWWWYRQESFQNAIFEANTSFEDFVQKDYPFTLLSASGEAVWLPDWVVWNSEVWHLTIWSWRIVYQSLLRINNSIKNWDFYKNRHFLSLFGYCQNNNKNLHILGLLQQAWVHSHINHLFALLDLAQKFKLKNIYLHIFTDWRDSPVNDWINQVKKLLDYIKKYSNIKIATVSWRFYSMDRDKRRDRTQKAYNAIVYWKSDIKFNNLLSFLENNYKNNITDEFIIPSVYNWYNWFEEWDWVLFFNFRTDRPRQLTKVIIEPVFDGFDRKYLPVKFVAMTKYYSNMNWKVAFDDISMKNILWEVVSKNWLKQLRISETEKYAHVTFFFNWQQEQAFEWEDRILIPSPKVETYDQTPQMSIDKLNNKIIDNIKLQKYDLIVTNLVNLDLVWHTWNFEAIKKAVEYVDNSCKKIVEFWQKFWYSIILTADHWNAEDQTEKWKTSHTTNPVPFILIDNDFKNIKLKFWMWLKDIAPTILKLLWIDKPKEMTWDSIF